MEAAELSFWAFSLQVVLPRVIEGFWLTLKLTLLSGSIGILWGLTLALARMSKSRVLSLMALTYITLFRGTPLLLQILFFFFALPELMPFARFEAVTCGIIALSLNAGAYLAEIFRAAIESIDRGQWEASAALGLTRAQTLRRVILPQSFKRLIPPVVNELAALAKDTSLVSVIALSELLFVTQRLAAKYLRPWEVFFWSAIGYLLIVLTFSTLAHRLEKRLQLKGA